MVTVQTIYDHHQCHAKLNILCLAGVEDLTIAVSLSLYLSFTQQFCFDLREAATVSPDGMSCLFHQSHPHSGSVMCHLVEAITPGIYSLMNHLISACQARRHQTLPVLGASSIH